MNGKKLAVLCFLFANFLSKTNAGVLEFFYHHQHKKPPHSFVSAHIKAKSIQQPIDHANPSLGHFTQRYFIDETYGKKNDSPVFFYICGEGTCSKDDLTGAIREYASTFHAKLVALEHRFYGRSIPFNNFAVSSLHYLTTKEALDDLAYFQNQMVQEKQWTGKWVVFGGSYPGNLAAYYRLKYPNLVLGAIASSAPVMAKENFIEYDTLITQVVGPACAKDMQDVVAVIEQAMNNENEFNHIKTLFDAADIDDPIDFLSLVADVGAIAVQYGNSEDFCKTLSSAETPLEGYAIAAKNLFSDENARGVQFSPQVLTSDDPKDYNAANSWLRPWFYQTCTEYGYQQNANSDRSKSTRSIHLNTKYQHVVCHQLFRLSKPAKIEYMNNTYYWPLINGDASNIYFTNGENDPWSTLSLTAANGNTQNANLAYHTIEGASHCVDMEAADKKDSKSLNQARKATQRLLAQWLGVKN